MFILIAQQTVDIASQAKTISPIGDVGTLVQMGAWTILTIGGLALFMYLLLGGFNWITAGGEKGKIEAAREMITQGIIGLAILAAVFAVYAIVLRFFGITSITLGAGGGGTNTSIIGGSNNNGGSDTCTVGAPQVSDGGAGHYCTNGAAAMVVCVAAGLGPSHFTYAHYEPVSCATGSSLLQGYQFYP